MASQDTDHSASSGKRTGRFADKSALTRSRLEFAAVMLLVAITLLPMLASGFYGDDGAGSLVTARLLAMKGETLLGHMTTSVLGWITSIGRFFPLGAYGAVLFWLVNGNPLVYKAILLSLVMLNAGLLYAFVRRLTGSTGLSAVAVLAFSLALQFRFYHEPILSYTALLPIITALVLMSLIWFVAYLDSGRRRLLVVSVVAFSATLLIYEVALPMCVLFFALALLYPSRRSPMDALRASWAFFAAATAAVGIVLALRLVLQFQPKTAEQVSGYAINLSPVPVVLTVLKQMVAAVPLSQYGSRMAASALGLTFRQLYASPWVYLSAHPLATAAGAIVFFAVGLFVLLPLLASRDRISAPSTRALLVVGLGFLVLPNLLISLAAKHQLGVGWGQGYLPAYMSAVGVALLVASCMEWVRGFNTTSRHSAAIAVFLALIIGFVGALNLDNNRITVEGQNRAQSYPARVVAKAASVGLLDPVPDGSWLLSNAETAWQVTDFYRLHADKVLSGAVPVTTQGSLAGLPLIAREKTSAEATSYVVNPQGPQIYYLFVESSTRDSGYALLSRVETVTASEAGVSFTWTPLRVYRTWPAPSRFDWLEVQGWPSRPISYRTVSSVDSALAGATTIASGHDWALQEVPAGWTVSMTGFVPQPGRSWLDYPAPQWTRNE